MEYIKMVIKMINAEFSSINYSEDGVNIKSFNLDLDNPVYLEFLEKSELTHEEVLLLESDVWFTKPSP